MLRILTFIVLFSEIEMYYTPHNRTVVLKINDLEIHESKNGKNEVNKGKIYGFVDQEDVKITCNAYNLTSKQWVLYLKEGENILKSYYTDKGNMNGEIVKNITLTANMSGRHYKCELFIGSQLNRSKINNNESICSVNEEDLEATTSIVLKVVFRVAKLNIFVNKCKLKKNNIGTEVVYKYTNNEKIFPMCINDDAANEAEWLPPAFYFFAIYEHKLSATLYSYSKSGLTSKENGSYFDCVEKNYSNNGTTRTNIQRRPKLRLRFILLDANEPRPTCSKDPEPACPDNDLDADTCNNQDLCITGYDESKVTKIDGLITYRYNSNTNRTVKLECHRKSTSRSDTYIQWIGPSIASNKTNCKSQILFVNLNSNVNRRVYYCEGGNYNERYIRAAIEFIYVDPKVEKPLENLTENMEHTNKENTDVKSVFKPEHWILLSIGIICLVGAIIAVVKRDKIWKMRKSRKQDKVDLNLDNSRSDAPDEYTNILQSPPTPNLCETYTEPKPYNTINPEIYCEPYSAMYLQPLPKGIRPKKNSENHSKVLVYNNDPVTYSDEKNLIYHNLVNDYTTASYMNVKQARDNVNSDPNVYDVAT